jgi:hypothetical protein
MASCVVGELIPCAFVWHNPELPRVAKLTAEKRQNKNTQQSNRDEWIVEPTLRIDA